MHGSSDYYSEWSKSDKNKYVILTYMWNPENNTSEQMNRNKLIDTEKEIFTKAFGGQIN